MVFGRKFSETHLQHTPPVLLFLAREAGSVGRLTLTQVVSRSKLWKEGILLKHN